jgi:hypothetical protein
MRNSQLSTKLEKPKLDPEGDKTACVVDIAMEADPKTSRPTSCSVSMFRENPSRKLSAERSCMLNYLTRRYRIQTLE